VNEQVDQETSGVATDSLEAPVLRVEADGPVRVLTLNRPDRRNAINAALHEELTYVWARLTADRDARVVVLTGAGSAFSAGVDPDFVNSVVEDEAFRWRIFDEERRLVSEFARFPLPVIAAVNGPALGVASSLVSLCDLVLMSPRAYFADPHVLLGVAPGDGTIVTWPHLMGSVRAKYHLFTGDPIDAETAVEFGLANRVLSGDELLPKALELAHRLAGQPPAALRAAKRGINIDLERRALAVMDYISTAEEGHFADPGLRDRLDKLVHRK
jgi:enoyl-CoA hydratase